MVIQLLFKKKNVLNLVNSSNSSKEIVPSLVQLWSFGRLKFKVTKDYIK